MIKISKKHFKPALEILSVFIFIVIFGFSIFGFFGSQINKAQAAVTYQTPGAIAYSSAGGASVSPAYPVSITAGDLLVLIIGMKPSVANGGSVTTPVGWTAIPSGSLAGAGGYGTTLGADTGNTNVFTFYKVAVGGETGSLAVTITDNNISWAQMYRFSAGVGSTWNVAGTTGSDITAGNVSIAHSANPGVTAGDYILGAMVIPTDVTTPSQFSTENLSQTGIYFGTITEISEPDTTLGNDIGGVTYRAPISYGTALFAPTFTATAGGTTTNVRGPGVFIRVREINNSPAVVLNTADAFNFGADTTPTVDFTGTDAEANDVEYNVQIDTVNTFNSQQSSADVSTASYASKYFSVTSQEATPSDLTFSSDGTKMYVIGYTSDTVYQYALTTAWDVSTANYTVPKSYNIAAQELNPQGLAFSSDGTKMYIVGFNNATVYQYVLTTAWDVSTANYTVPKSYTETQNPWPEALAFSSDGTKMYMVMDDDRVYQYTLATAWDVSTASYSSLNYLGMQEPYYHGLTFSSDGTKMYMIGNFNDAVYQYTLSTAWDVSTASYASLSYLQTQEGQPYGLTFSSDGSKMYIVGITNDRVSQYDMSAPILDKVSVADAGFINPDVGGDLHPFISGDNIQYTVQGANALSLGTTYYWRVRGKDPLASNAYGAWSGTKTFIIAGPPTIASPTAANITDTTATLGANITSDGGSAITARGTCWGTAPAPTGNCLPEGGTTTGIFTHARTGMSPGTLIYYRGYATNSVGTEYSADGNFTTFAVGVPTVTLPTATGITQTTATLGANVAFDGGYSITARGTCWGTAPAPTTNCLAEGGVTTGIFTHARTGMSQDTLIYYRGYATNSIGTSYSVDGSFTTIGSFILDESFTNTTFPPITCSGWTTGGNASWARDAVTFNTAPASAVAPASITDNQSSWIDCNLTLTIPATLTFYWKVSSESGWDFLNYCEDIDATCTRTIKTLGISGTVAWTQITRSLATGTHSLRWLYAKDGSVSSGSDVGWIDNVLVSVSVLPTVISPTATSITSSGATLGANITSDGGSAITARGTCWGTAPAPTTNCLAEGGVTTGIFTHARTGMSPGTLIYYRGYATNSVGTEYSADGNFTTSLPAPTLTSVTGENPQTTAGGKSITINGANFEVTPTVTIGGTPATGVVRNSSTQLTATAPAKASGSYNVIVTNPDLQQSNTCVNCMTYISPPTVTTVNPNNNLNLVGGQTVTVSGSDIKVGANGVKVDTTLVTTSGISSSATFTTPAHAVGSVTLRVYGTSGTDTNGIYTDYAPFTYTLPAPTLTSVTGENPQTTAGGKSITINGANFETTPTVTIGGTPATGVVLNSSTQLTATAPAKASGSYNVIVTNPDLQQSNTCVNCMSYYSLITGYLISSTFDTGHSGGVSFNSIMWKGNPGTGGSVRFQLASSNSSTGPWSYIGPGGSSSTTDSYITTGSNAPVAIIGAHHNNKRYYRYKIYLDFKDIIGLTRPVVNGVIVNWSP